ncbi:MAG: aldo/keto reductase [Calditrichaceae bacterium]|nr:aldo/keto reductase [Calditrichaceae bacterium]
MQNRAALNATKELSEKYSELTYNPMGNTGLLCSQAGFGSYRVQKAIPAHKEALEHALLNGINLIDTSTNYGDGGSEELIGKVIKKLIAAHKINRDQIIVTSKAGYIQNRNFQESQNRKRENNPWPDLVEYGPDIEHCIHPEFLEDQLNKSINRLQLETIDFYLLHNPEYYLSWAHEVGIPLTEARQTYYQRISQSFNYLEKEAAKGRIQYYGISSNTFPGHTDEHNFTCLETIWHIANNISTKHHFRAVQMPMNLIEYQAVTTINQPSMQSALEFACIKGLAVLINRPFNAFINHRLFRLVDITGSLSGNMSEMENLLNELIRQENYFDHSLIDTFEFDEATKKRVQELFSTGSYLAVNWQKLGPYQQWIDSQSRILVDRINHGMEILTSFPDLNDNQKKWIDFYIVTFNKALDSLTARYRAKAAREIDQFKKAIQSLDDQWDGAKKLSHKVLRALRTTRGVSCVLTGMRHIDYVNDVLEELKTSVEIRDEMHAWLELKERANGLYFE